MKNETYNMIKSFMWFAFERSKIKEDAEDIIQDVAIKILKRIDWFESIPERGQVNYIMVSIRNRHTDLVKREKVGKRDVNYHGVQSNKINPDVYGIITLKEVKQKALGYKDYCDVLFLSSEGYLVREITKLYQLKRDNIAGKIFRARKFLKSN